MASNLYAHAGWEEMNLTNDYHSVFCLINIFSYICSFEIIRQYKNKTNFASVFKYYH